MKSIKGSQNSKTQGVRKILLRRSTSSSDGFLFGSRNGFASGSAQLGMAGSGSKYICNQKKVSFQSIAARKSKSSSKIFDCQKQNASVAFGGLAQGRKNLRKLAQEKTQNSSAFQEYGTNSCDNKKFLPEQSTGNSKNERKTLKPPKMQKQYFDYDYLSPRARLSKLEKSRDCEKNRLIENLKKIIKAEETLLEMRQKNKMEVSLYEQIVSNLSRCQQQQRLVNSDSFIVNNLSSSCKKSGGTQTEESDGFNEGSELQVDLASSYQITSN